MHITCVNGGKTFEFKAVADGLGHHEPAYHPNKCLSQEQTALQVSTDTMRAEQATYVHQAPRSRTAVGSVS